MKINSFLARCELDMYLDELPVDYDDIENFDVVYYYWITNGKMYSL